MILHTTVPEELIFPYNHKEKVSGWLFIKVSL